MVSITALSTEVCSQAEFEALLGQQMENMRHLALRYTRSADLAADLLQDTVVRALTYRQRFSRGTNFRAWLGTVLTNTFLQKYRRQKREKEILSEVSRFDVLQNLRSEDTRRKTREPERNLTESGFGDDVKKALAALPTEFRKVVDLCDVQGLSYRQVAERLECPLGTVMSRLHRGRKLLQKDLRGTAADSGIGLAAASKRSTAPSRRPQAPRRGVIALAKPMA
jgi:RNA polymerase sigma-70 factor (ECF subfamily)